MNRFPSPHDKSDIKIILQYVSERDPCTDAVCRFTTGYCIYDNRAAYCSCHDSWRGIDCAGSNYGKCIYAIVLISKSNNIACIKRQNDIFKNSQWMNFAQLWLSDKQFREPKHTKEVKYYLVSRRCSYFVDIFTQLTRAAILVAELSSNIFKLKLTNNIGHPIFVLFLKVSIFDEQWQPFWCFLDLLFWLYISCLYCSKRP